MLLMVRESRVGRPPGDGPRYECGRRKPPDDPRAHATVQFIRHDASRFADPKTKSELGLLLLGAEVTDRQAEAGFTVARIYGAIERYKRKRRSVGSPGYLRAFGDPSGDDDPENPSAEPLLLPDEDGRLTRPRRLTGLERSIQEATSRMEKLQGCFDIVPPSLVASTRALVEKLCVENRRVSGADLEHIAPMLDYIAQVFEIPGAVATTNSIAITARRPRRRPPTPTRERRADIDKGPWVQVTKAMRPDLDDAGIERAWVLFNECRQAHKDRDRFRREKGRGR